MATRPSRPPCFISGKPDTFIAGADIEEFLEVRSAEDAERLSLDGQSLLDRLEQLRMPVVAAIHGACLGGGLEMALACAYRIATDHPKTVLALPEVQLGLIPGAGGTQRLPQLVGLRNALDMILTGRNVRAKKALQMGLVDEMVHPSILREVAVKRARELGRGERKRSSGRKTLSLADLALEKNPAGRAIVFRKAREKVRKQTRGHYPAPLAAIDAVAAGYSTGPRWRDWARKRGSSARWRRRPCRASSSSCSSRRARSRRTPACRLRRRHRERSDASACSGRASWEPASPPCPRCRASPCGSRTPTTRASPRG